MNLNTLSDPLIICPKWKHFLWCCQSHWSPITQVTQTSISRNTEKMFIPLWCSWKHSIAHIIILSPITSTDDGIQDIIFLPPSESQGQSGCSECLIIVARSGLRSPLSAGCNSAVSSSLPHCQYKPRSRLLTPRGDRWKASHGATQTGLTWYSLGDRPRGFVSRKVGSTPSSAFITLGRG